MKDIFFIAVQKDVRTPFNFFPVLKNIVLPDNTLPIVQDMLQSFSSQADFKEQMKLAFGDGYDVSKADVLVDAWEDENLGFLPEIKIVSENQINGANGAFAGETETIYLAQEFVLENLGNVEAIASVILEEFGHYIDGEVNSIDTPGDEGGFFASFVLGEELSADELLRMKVEDDWAIGFLDGEMVSIEQAEITQTDTLDFFAGEIQDWGGFPSEDLRFTLFDEKIPEQPIEQNVNNSFISYDFGVQASLKGELFANPGSFGKARFSYPIQIDTQLPTQVSSGEAFAIIPGVNANINQASFSNIGQGTEGFEIPNAGINFSLDLGSAKFQNIEINNPFGDPIRLDGIDVGTKVGKAELNLDIASFLAGQVRGDLLGGKISAKLPKINSLEPTNPSGNGNTEQLPSIAATGKTDNVLNLALDLDEIILSKVPAYAALQQSLIRAETGIELNNGLGFAIDFPNAAEKQARAAEARDRANKAREDLKIQLDVLRTIPPEGQTLALQEAERLRQITEQTRLEAEALEQGVKEVKELLKQQRNKIQLSGDILDIQANVGIGFQQEYSFIPEDVEVRFSVEEGAVDEAQESTKTLGETFNITAPSEGTGVMEVKAEYKLSGDVKNDIGLILQGSLDGKALELAGNITLGGAKVFQEQFGPVVNVKIPSGGLASPPFTIIGSDPDPIPFLPSDPTIGFRQFETINTDEIGGEEDVTKNLLVETTYYIPYGMPVSISDASVTEGETLQFTVTLTEPSDEPVSVDYKSEKGSGTVSFAPGETTQIIEIPTPDDTVEEPTETFEISLNNPNGISFPEKLPNGESTISATGTIFDDDGPPKPKPPKTDTSNDPRLVTFDRLFYDFQAVGEFTLFRTDSGDLNVQVRQEPISETNESVSINTAVATILNGQRVGLYVDRDPRLLVDGTPVEIADNDSVILGEGRIFRDGNEYTIQYPGGQQLIAKFRGQRIDIQAFLGPGLEGQVSGIVGNNNGDRSDDIALPDGTVFQQPVSDQLLYNDFANSWRVTPETSLFDYKPGEDTTTFTNLKFPVGTISLDELDPVARQEAEQLADEFGLTDPTLRTAAIIDFVLTGDRGIFEAALESQVPEAALIIDIEPEAVADTAITAINTPNIINVLANDISTQGTPLSLETFPQTSAGGGIITRSDNGTPEDTTDDQLIYTPPINYSGTDTFQYTINDGDQTASGIVTVNIPGVNLGNFDNGFTVNGANPGNFSGASVSNIRDFNGDQIDDFIIGAFGTAPNDNTAAGEAYVIFGTDNGLPSDLDLANLGNNGIVLQGIEFQGLLGSAVSEAGDVNNDGIDDLIIGAIGATANGNSNAGRTYVVFGNTQLPVSIDISQLNGFNGFTFEGINAFDYAGLAVGGAGDVNNDGIDDLFVTAPGPLSNPPSSSYIIYGDDTGFPATVNASQLNGFNGFIITDLQGQAGSTVNNAGDVNNDGIPDLIIGADANFTDSYVIYGGYPYPGFVELSSTINGTNGFVLTGIDVQNSDGTTVQGVGDVNNDGIDDIMVAVSGTTIVDNLPITKGYVVFGNPSLPYRFDLSTLNGSNGFVINDFNIDDIVGFSIGKVGDFNLDGVDDIVIGTSQADTNNTNAGKGYVVFGKSDGVFPANINLSTLGSQNGLVFNGAEIDDLTGTSIDGAGDVNNDGVKDLIIGAPGSLFNDVPGKSYVVFGSNNFGNSTALVFDETYYLNQNPEIATSVANGAFRNGLDHFSKLGVQEGRDFQVLFNS